MSDLESRLERLMRLAWEYRYASLGEISAADKDLRAALREELRDGARMDWLEQFVADNGEIHLHDGMHPHGTGLGMRDRTLRAAIDDAQAPIERDCCGTLLHSPHRSTCEKYRGRKERSDG